MVFHLFQTHATKIWVGFFVKEYKQGAESGVNVLGITSDVVPTEASHDILVIFHGYHRLIRHSCNALQKHAVKVAYTLTVSQSREK
ncbi:hypothetical protein PG996_012825 [Apiospora saccharicola]|uniref:Uncharacterized protein n=1 Tax=Apiospora saccharicola TaxID=335842 RepID=A0ABR1U6H7_9PEZI